MSRANRERKQQNREARIGAIEEAQRRARRQRVEVVIGATVLALIVAIVLVAHAKSDKKSATTTTTSGPSTTTIAPTTTTALPSAAGKPCRAVSGPLPKGAPAVPVTTGSPPTKLVTKDLKVGKGALVKSTATVTVNYVGVACSTGKVFASSYTDGQEFTSALSDVIPGWQGGIPGMRVGGERLLGIPPAQAYGKGGSAPEIAPDETLWFVVQLVSVK